MRVCFVMNEGRSGGVSAVLGHVARLRARGHDVEVLAPGPAPEFVPEVPVRPLAEAAGEPYDVALATWWETAADVFAVEAGRRALFLQNIEHRYYHADEPWDRLAASISLALPLDVVATAHWMANLVRDLRPGGAVEVAPYGIDKRVFAPRPREPGTGPLRVLVEGQPSIWWKGVEDSLRAVRAMSEPAEVTVVSLDPSAAAGLDADRVVGGLDPAGMADLYARTDVVLKLGRFEGFGLAPLEAFHLGVPCVVTPYSGHEEYVVHGENGLVAGFDDLPAATRWLDLLARDRALLARLGDGAVRTAEGWPDPEASTAELERALVALLDAPPARTEEAFPRMLREVRAAAEVNRHASSGAGDPAGLERAQALVDELSYSREECKRALNETLAELDRRNRQYEEVISTRAYRTAVSARRILDLVRR